jgi:hypothetical protein
MNADKMIEKKFYTLDSLKAADIFTSGCVFGSFLAEGQHPFSIKLQEAGIKDVYAVDDLNGDEEAYKLIQSMVDPDPKQRPTATKVLN